MTNDVLAELTRPVFEFFNPPMRWIHLVFANECVHNVDNEPTLVIIDSITCRLEYWIHDLHEKIKLLRSITTIDSAFMLVPDLPGSIDRLIASKVFGVLHHTKMVSLFTSR